MPRTFAFVLLRGAVLTPRPPMELEIQKGIGRKQPPPGGYFTGRRNLYTIGFTV